MKKILNICIIIAAILTATFVFSISANAETVYVSSVSQLQSSHPYSDNMDKTWVYTHPTSADSLEVTFSSDTETESNYDYIYIYEHAIIGTREENPVISGVSELVPFSF